MSSAARQWSVATLVLLGAAITACHREASQGSGDLSAGPAVDERSPASARYNSIGSCLEGSISRVRARVNSFRFPPWTMATLALPSRAETPGWYAQLRR